MVFPLPQLQELEVDVLQQEPNFLATEYHRIEGFEKAFHSSILALEGEHRQGLG